mgnify:CR=1 FL=1
MILRPIFYILVLLLLINCSDNSSRTDSDSKKLQFDSPESEYKKAMLMFDKEQYDQANKVFRNIERIYPLSNEAIQSQIMQAFTDYILLNYDESIMKFNKIINKYPSLKNLDYVYYMRALCYYEQISHEGLDGKYNTLALENLDQVIKRFPNSKYAKDSYQKIMRIKPIGFSVTYLASTHIPTIARPAPICPSVPKKALSKCNTSICHHCNAGPTDGTARNKKITIAAAVICLRCSRDKPRVTLRNKTITTAILTTKTISWCQGTSEKPMVKTKIA